MMAHSGGFPFALVVAAALSLHSSTSYGEIYPVSGGGDPRIRVAVYSAEQVYRLRGLVGYQST